MGRTRTRARSPVAHAASAGRWLLGGTHRRSARQRRVEHGRQPDAGPFELRLNDLPVLRDIRLIQRRMINAAGTEMELPINLNGGRMRFVRP